MRFDLELGMVGVERNVKGMQTCGRKNKGMRQLGRPGSRCEANIKRSYMNKIEKCKLDSSDPEYGPVTTFLPSKFVPLVGRSGCLTTCIA